MVLAPEKVAVPKEEVTPIRFSEAMRLGCLVTERLETQYVDNDDSPKAACAIGAAWIGAGMPDTPALYARQFCDANSKFLPCEHRIGGSHDLYGIVTHLNDVDHWPREKIADWLESIGY